MDDRPALLLIAHGTRDPRGAEEMETLLAHVRRLLETPVAASWLEDFASPDTVTAVAELAAAGARRVVTLPFLNFAAGHAKTDVPGELAQARAAHPEIELVHGQVLGLHPQLFAVARERVAQAGASATDALLVAASGSSDPDANGDLAKAARYLAELSGHRWVDHAFAGVSWPTADVALRRMAAGGARTITIFSWSLLAGLLEQRVLGWAADVESATGVQVLDAGRFGPDPRVAEAVVDRYREALAGAVRVNCDLCQFRLPLPGREQRAGAPSAGGTGSHLTPEAAAVQRERRARGG